LKSPGTYISAFYPITNAVGYSQSELDNNGGSVIVTPQFLGIGTTGGAVDIQSIQCNEDAVDLVYLNTLDNLGYTVDTYDWTIYKGKMCWVDESTGKPAEVTFAPGQAFWVQSDEAGNVFQSSGQVGTEDVEVELDNDGGSIMCGNCTPVSVDIQDVLCNAEAVDLVYLNTLDELGYTVDTYDWTMYKGTMCWVDESTGKPADETFAPGQAFWVQSDEAGNTITFPGVDLNN
jgi:hypothetical protein